MNPAWTRDDAERIARVHVVAHGGTVGEHVFTARTLNEIRHEGIHPPMLYDIDHVENLWIVYVHDANPLFALRSSRIIVVSMADESIEYSGSAHDEG